MSFQEWIN